MAFCVVNTVNTLVSLVPFVAEGVLAPGGDRFAANDRDLRLLDHAAYLYRDGLMAVPGLDDAGRWIPWVWAWVINLAVGNRPLILQKSGGLRGYLCISGDSAAPGVAAFFVMNEFSTGGCTAAVAATNGLIGQLVPR